jgi:hypothetical protein
MASNSESLKRIKSDIDDFHTAVEEFKSATVFNRKDCRDAYAGASRVRDRFKEEEKRGDMTPGGRKVLSNVFNENVFTKGMMQIRQVGEHVVQNTDFTIRTPHGAPIILPATVSAMAMFSNFTVTLNDTTGRTHQINHCIWLSELDKSFRKALEKAENS